MYSVQHVLWRGVMALSLLVVGGVGAGVSEQSAPPLTMKSLAKMPRSSSMACRVR